jgi:hypothetical protein
MTILISGPKIVLRDRLPSDADRYVYWLDHGEWLEYDAPWEDNFGPLTPERRRSLSRRSSRAARESIVVRGGDQSWRSPMDVHWAG